MDDIETQLEKFLEGIRTKDPNEKEFFQAVEEFAETVIPFMAKNEKYNIKGLLERMCEPERVIIFRVPWQDDNGNAQVNRGFRIQMSSALGPYKGGLRFHPTVTLSVLKFLAFEQVFKNSLTTLPLGGGKGGSDFNPKGKSNNEVMRFCQSFMTELSRHIGPDTDIPAGDIGVGAREIGFLYGQYKRLANEFTGVLTGKPLEFGGSLMRTQATGYGLVYFSNEMLKVRGEELVGKVCAVSGSGNVAQYTIEKLIQLGAKVVTVSDSQGCVYDPNGITQEKLAFIKELKNVRRGRISEYVEKFENAEFHQGITPWSFKVDLAYPCATQNELPENEAQILLENGCMGVFEGANMPTTAAAMHLFKKHKIMFSPGKASNAGGVATSGLEMAQNSQRIYWTSEEVDSKLKEIMSNIHQSCAQYGKNDEDDFIDYVRGANIAGFVKVADAMLSQGIV
ncbi:MAG: NADP-specific glutamate dehydrogenase [Cyclobacteriaceae bacterium]